MPEFQEEHARGELLVAAMMNAFLDIWLQRLAKIGPVAGGKRDRSIVVEEGARVAGHLLTMAIRAIDYCPPTDIWFSDYLSALLTVDREVVPDQGKYDYRGSAARNFNGYGIEPARGTDADGTWKLFDKELVLQPQPFRLDAARPRGGVPLPVGEPAWRSRSATTATSRCSRCGRASGSGRTASCCTKRVAEYIQILTLWAGELKSVLGIAPPDGNPGQPANPDFRRRRPDLRRVRPAQVPHPGPARGPRARAADRAARAIWPTSGFFAEPPEPRPLSGNAVAFRAAASRARDELRRPPWPRPQRA